MFKQPYTNFHEINLNWILKQLKKIMQSYVMSVNGQTGDVTLSASDVGALPDSYTAPVTSVNSKTGAVTLAASDVGALPDTYTAPVTSVNNATGAVTIDQVDSVTDMEDPTGAIEFSLDTGGKGQYRAVGASTWIPFLTGGKNSGVFFSFGHNVVVGYAGDLYDALLGPDMAITGAGVAISRPGTYQITAYVRGVRGTNGSVVNATLAITDSGSPLLSFGDTTSRGTTSTTTITVTTPKIIEARVSSANSNYIATGIVYIEEV